MLAINFYLCLGLLGFPHFSPALPLRFGDPLAGFLTQDSFCPWTTAIEMTECIQRLPHAFYVLLQTDMFGTQGSHCFIEVTHS